ncbi:Glutathione synthetase [Lamellibrachia satsuma]|nr:Glutathione synthetase [Lamellibrachia satsuma]
MDTVQHIAFSFDCLAQPQRLHVFQAELELKEDAQAGKNAKEMEGCISLPIPDDKLEDLIVQAKDYALSHGIIVRTRDNPTSAEVATYAPFMLFPSPLPRLVFEQAQAVQKDFNLMMHRVAHDYDFLKDCLASTTKVDSFTRHMWEIYETVYKEGIIQPMCLAINRSDYMFDSQLDDSSGSHVHLRQIEFNTMASSFGGLSQKLADLHRYVLGLCGQTEKAANVPENRAADGIARAMVTAWMAYNNPNAAVLFLILSTEGNMYDQRWLEYGINSLNPNVKVIRRSIQDLAKRAVLSEDKCLIIDGVEVAVVYQRSCYVPDHFESEKDWEARLLVERSRAIKCPNIAYHLAGTKKVQQVLALPGMVQKFASSPEASARITGTFAKLYSLDRGVEGDEAIAAAVQSPERFVLKPQREGGGNNTYGDDIVRMLNKIQDTDERLAYILMERISPPAHRNYPIRVGAPVSLQVLISELGMYGTLVGTKDKVILNEQTGHNLRTKSVDINEGGVATGYSALDSPFLV